MRSVSLLGSTGSIGANVCEVVRQFPERYRLVALAAGSNYDALAKQIIEFKPELVAIGSEEGSSRLRDLLPPSCRPEILVGPEGNCAVAAHPDAQITISAIVGSAGLLPTLSAIRAGKDIGLANKETLVMAGKIVMDEVARHGVVMLPVDSEHSAIFQALEAGRRDDVKKIILTASGGPFRGRDRAQLEKVTREEALNHPNWSMGRKISIDSATLMNKGLEVIEARWLFGVADEHIEVVVHPQSIIHSLVEFIDGSVVAQLGIPDMRIPIAYALSYPERLPLDLPRLSLAQCANLAFHDPDFQSFPALRLAYDALRSGGVMPAVLNAANEIAVEAFLDAKLDFLQIAETVEETMAIIKSGSEDNLDDILQADGDARRTARHIIQKLH